MPSKVAKQWKDELASGETYRQKTKTALQYLAASMFKAAKADYQLRQNKTGNQNSGFGSLRRA